ncbi:MAG TPA: hypothetical protein VGB92_07390 [Longimicrobium sp.]|jgi:hypothetical protein
MRPSVAATLLALVLAAGACGEEPARPRELRDAAIVLRLPDDALYGMTAAPDGTLFLSTFRGAIYRSRDAGRGWDRVSQQQDTGSEPALLYLYAPSRTTLFAVRSGGSEVYRWDEGKGLRPEPTPVAGRWHSCGHTAASASLIGVWGRSAREVYAVGMDGLVLRFDGARWAVERNPLSDSAGPCGEWGTRLEAVGGDDRYVYAAGSRTMRRSQGGSWELLPRAHRPGEVSVVRGIATGDGGPVFGGIFQKPSVGSAAGPIRLFRPVPQPRAGGSAWEMLWAGGPYVEMFEVGTSAPGSPPVFFDMASPNIFVLDRRRLRRYRAPELTEIRGAAVVGRHVVVAGGRDATALVVRGRFP